MMNRGIFYISMMGWVHKNFHTGQSVKITTQTTEDRKIIHKTFYGKIVQITKHLLIVKYKGHCEAFTFADVMMDKKVVPREK